MMGGRTDSFIRIITLVGSTILHGIEIQSGITERNWTTDFWAAK
jgi:hypothetical protein